MRGQRFSLQPFPPGRALPPVKITGRIQRRAQRLAMGYELCALLAELVIPGPAERPARRRGLWEETCFEFFLAPKNAPHYWEFNLSPAGHWNVYRFAGYRQGMQEELTFAALPFSVSRRAGALVLALECDIDRIVPAGQALEAAIAAVIKLAPGEATYWALTHPGLQPDFHRRDSFIVAL